MPKRVSLKGKGADLFFGDYPADTTSDTTAVAAAADSEPGETASPRDSQSSAPSAPEPELEVQLVPTPARREPSPRRSRPTNNARTPGGESGGVLASVDAGTVETIRQVIKAPGREVSYLRLTPEEKADLADIVYTYKRQGQKTSETEINRIALNYLLLDYREHGQQSVLARVLAALLA